MALDTNVVIYFIELHPTFRAIVRPVFEAISAGRITAAISTITLLEVLVELLRAGRTDLVNDYREHLMHSQGLSLVGIDERTAELAAHIRADHNLQVPDAVIAASAVVSECSHLIANDPVFTRVPNFRTLVVAEFT